MNPYSPTSVHPTDIINEPGVWLLAGTLLVLASFPLIIYWIFNSVLLERISQGLINEFTDRKAFEMKAIKEELRGPEGVKDEIRKRYNVKRFIWPVGLLFFCHIIGFSVMWDLILHRFEIVTKDVIILYNNTLLSASELPMMAFLGVVIFNYGHMLRRLYVWDITTHVFWNALYRTWLVIGVSVVLTSSVSFAPKTGQNELDAKTHLEIAFFALGFIINPVLQSLIEQAQTRFKVKKLKVEQLPLSLIQGINFWHEYRLEEEGIENVQNLATCDIIDLALTTRFNLRTLVDWIDQAILIHRMGEKAITLRKDSFISGAIDMAWSSPLNSGKENKLPEEIAKTVGVKAAYISSLMNNLYEDSQVNMLWDLWQSELDAKNKDKFR